MATHELIYLAVDAVLFFSFGVLFASNNKAIAAKMSQDAESIKDKAESETAIVKEFIQPK